MCREQSESVVSAPLALESEDGRLARTCGGALSLSRQTLSSVCEYLRSYANSKFGQQTLIFGLRALYSICEHLRSECKRCVRYANVHVRSANARVQSANADFGLRTLCSAWERRVRSANTHVRSASAHVRNANAEFGL